MSKEQLAIRMYNMYRSKIETNQVMLEWDELTEPERRAWVDVAAYVINDIVL